MNNDDNELHDLFNDNLAVQSGLSGADLGIVTVHDKTGYYAFSPDSLPRICTFDGPNGLLNKIIVGPDRNGNSFQQTLTYTGTQLTTISAWTRI